MAENATATEWPSTPIVPEAKALFDRLFEILDDNTPDAGQKLATEIFAPNAKFVTSSGVFQGEKGCREKAWGVVVSRVHKIAKVYTCTEDGSDLLMIGDAVVGLINGKSVAGNFIARCVLEGVGSKNVKIGLFQVWGKIERGSHSQHDPPVLASFPQFPSLAPASLVCWKGHQVEIQGTLGEDSGGLAQSRGVLQFTHIKTAGPHGEGFKKNASGHESYMMAVSQFILTTSDGVFDDDADDGVRHRLSIAEFPLTVLALIVSHLDNVADLARVCLVSRVFNYMAIPLLYKDLILTTEDKRSLNGEFQARKPKGSFSGSLSTGINAIVKGNLGPLVHSLTLQGEWREDVAEDHLGGFMTDSLTMLNIAVRAAIDKTRRLESFSWELNNKMLDTLYLGLSQLRLTTLHLRFPSISRPTSSTLIPAMPHLLSLSISNIDPQCYPDDISTLLCSKNLQELKLHWSRRIIDVQEPSINLHDYFRKCMTGSPLRIKKLSFQNLYTPHTDDLFKAIDKDRVEELTVLNSSSCTFAMIFLGPNSPREKPLEKMKFKCMRHDKLSKAQRDFLGAITGLEKIYFVDQQDVRQHIEKPSVSPPGPEQQTLSAPSLDGMELDTIRVLPNGGSQSPPSFEESPKAMKLLRDSYFSTILTNHGAWLTHLLLSSKWLLSTSMIARMVHACPNLEQLGFATETASFDTMALLIPFLRKLVAIRLLVPVYPPGTHHPQPKHPKPNGGSIVLPLMSRPLAEVVELDESVHSENMGLVLSDNEAWGKLKLVGLGWKTYELGECYPEYVSVSRPPSLPGTPYLRPMRRTSTPATKPNGLHSNALHPVQSTLGKRTRELRSSSNPSIPEYPNGAPVDKSTPEPPDKENRPPGEREPEQIVWKRRIRRVGWEVCKNWDIWAMDRPDI
ncbi:hypothetical protein K432DRAFT_391110 [Lepidopterella palustris CBS 459.81]|uniref:F-box domain-containing protein n=1 Tax=Lepidopterella palustris CBS 459.81 TaxID=1314670 RepID=A0A8E2JHK0_9PEZI|nr:hypothetical protein K432DRAFT_391110 [Lepidopterella palustris CBS 459.81]